MQLRPLDLEIHTTSLSQKREREKRHKPTWFPLFDQRGMSATKSHPDKFSAEAGFCPRVSLWKPRGAQVSKFRTRQLGPGGGQRSPPVVRRPPA
jgi:hypothetical protein